MKSSEYKKILPRSEISFARCTNTLAALAQPKLENVGKNQVHHMKGIYFDISCANFHKNAPSI